MNPGEQAIQDIDMAPDGWWHEFMTHGNLPGVFAAAANGVFVVLEHRYWGGSSPYDTLTVEHLQYLTLDNALQDMTYFAQHWDAPAFLPNGSTSPTDVPWILCGGSYAGALTAWTAVLYPGVFWAYHAGSAVVEAVSNNWGYYAAVAKAAPVNCSTDLVALMAYVDGILLAGSGAEKTALKALFLLQDLGDVEFAMYV